MSNNIFKIVCLVSGVLLFGVGCVKTQVMEKPEEKPPSQPAQFEPTASATKEAVTNGLDKTYFESPSKREYVLFDVKTGERKNIIPESYEIVNLFEYDPNPQFLILKKDNNLFSYDMSRDAVRIFLTGDASLKTNEHVRLFPSITEKDKFFIAIEEYDSSEIDFGATPIHTRSYFFDTAANELTPTENLPYGNECAKYDSKNQRFFTWPCGEGIGSSLPLSIAEIRGQKQEEVISHTEFDLVASEIVAVLYNNGFFFALSKDGIDRIVVVDPMQKTPQKKIYTITEEVKSQMKKFFPHAAALVKPQNTIVISGGSFMNLLRFQDNQITESKIIPEADLYGNLFVFPHEDELYYLSKSAKAIRVIDSTTWKVVKTIPTETINAVITIFTFGDATASR